jgi:hypothetical protein
MVAVGSAAEGFGARPTDQRMAIGAKGVVRTAIGGLSGSSRDGSF